MTICGRRINKFAVRALSVLAFLGVSSAASAQGNSGSAPGRSRNGGKGATSPTPVSSPATSAEATVIPTTQASTLYYGSWLDDASVMAPRTAWVGLSTAYWNAAAGRQIDAPVAAAAIGISQRTQFGATVPIYHYRDATGVASHGMGNVDLYGKIGLADPSTRAVGVAVAPLVEISPSSDHRVGWALPINMEARLSGARLYGSVGYFSRGAAFGSVAAELPAGRHANVTGTIGQTYAGGGSRLTTVGGSVSVFANAATGFFVGLNRSFGGDAAASGTSIGGGVSLLLQK